MGVTGHSLRGRLVLPATLFFLTTLSLPWNRPRIPPPGRREGKKTTDRYCPDLSSEADQAREKCPVLSA